MKNIGIFIEGKSDVLSTKAIDIIGFANDFSSLLNDAKLYLYILGENEEVKVPKQLKVENVNSIKFGNGLISNPKIELEKLLTDLQKKDIHYIFGIKNIALDGLLSYISFKLNIPLLGQVSSISNDGEFHVVQQKVFSGKALTESKYPKGGFVALLANSFKLKGVIDKSDFNSISVSSIISSASDTINIKQKHEISNSVSLVDAEIVVGAGRGFKDPQNWNIVDEFANQLHAATACSKPVSDLHWRPHYEHVGQTGLKIAPNLYFACGISGAIQHLAGVNGSKIIVVINSDPEAPFFQHADYGIVGDVFDILPRLTKKVSLK